MILPLPKEIIEKDGFIQLNRNSCIIMESSMSYSILDSVQFFQEKVIEKTGITFNILKGESKRFTGIKLVHVTYLENECYELDVIDDHVEIRSHSEVGFHYGLMTLLQLIKKHGLKIPQLLIKDAPQISQRGFYHDMARGRVPKKETLFSLIDLLSEYKINELQIYIEHSFLWEDMSEVFRDKDALSAEDILELDRYALKRKVELVPSIATFGHLYEAMETYSFRDLCEKEIDLDVPYSFINRMAHHTVDVSNEKSIELVEHMIRSFIPLFSSNKFNICADETFDLGKHKNKQLAEDKGVGRLYIDYLNKIINIVQSEGKEALFWGDIILHHPELIEELPSNVTCLNWGYGAVEDESRTRTIYESGIPQYVCPAVSGWNRAFNAYDNASANIRLMTDFAKRNYAQGILNTNWGDYGHLNFLSTSIPLIIYGAAISWNPESLKDDVAADEVISKSYYGENHPHVVTLLRELSRKQAVDWFHIVLYFEKDFANESAVKPNLDQIRNLDYEKVLKAHAEIPELLNQLLDLSHSLPAEFHQDLNEWLIMADVMKLILESTLYLSKYGFEYNESVQLASDPLDLAENIEYLMEDYKTIWRKRNKESELFRITEKFYMMSDFIRKTQSELN